MLRDNKKRTAKEVAIERKQPGDNRLWGPSPGMDAHMITRASGVAQAFTDTRLSHASRMVVHPDWVLPCKDSATGPWVQKRERAVTHPKTHTSRHAGKDPNDRRRTFGQKHILRLLEDDSGALLAQQFEL